jgi:chemotaxis protein CheY-P-specific phosphatase CheC
MAVHSASHHYSEDQRDCLQEVTNVAMGQAGDALARKLGRFVELSIPVIRIIEPEQWLESINHFEVDTAVCASSQFFTDAREQPLSGLAEVILSEQTINELRELLGAPADADNSEVAKEACLCLAQSCLDAFAEHWELAFHCEAAKVEHFSELKHYCSAIINNWSRLLMVEVNYRLENSSFNGSLLLLFPDQAIERLAERLDALLA